MGEHIGVGNFTRTLRDEVTGAEKLHESFVVECCLFGRNWLFWSRAENGRSVLVWLVIT